MTLCDSVMIQKNTVTVHWRDFCPKKSKKKKEKCEAIWEHCDSKIENCGITIEYCGTQ